MKPLVTALGVAAGHLQQAIDVVHAERDGQARQCRRRRTDYMHMLRSGRARLHVVAGSRTPPRHNSATAPIRVLTPSSSRKFFMERMLPETATHLVRMPVRRRLDHGIAGGGVLNRYLRLDRRRQPQGRRHVSVVNKVGVSKAPSRR